MILLKIFFLNSCRVELLHFEKSDKNRDFFRTIAKKYYNFLKIVNNYLFYLMLPSKRVFLNLSQILHKSNFKILNFSVKVELNKNNKMPNGPEVSFDILSAIHTSCSELFYIVLDIGKYQFSESSLGSVFK